MCSKLETTTFIQPWCFIQPCHCHLWALLVHPAVALPSPRCIRSEERAQQHGLFRAATASKVIYHLLQAITKKVKKIELWFASISETDSTFFFSLPGLALTTNSGHLWLFFCNHHFDILRGLTMARCSPWNQIMITQPNNEHMLDGWHCHVWRLKSLYGYGLSH